MEAVDAYIGAGSNLGDRVAQLHAAVRGLARHGRICVAAVSPVYESDAHTLDPDDEQPRYLNAVLAVQTTFPARGLLYVCHRLERAAGRMRLRKWAPRPLDLDVLCYDALSCYAPDLAVPHPRLHERRFVLRPWADIAPNLCLPSPFEKTVTTLLNQCSDGSAVVRTRHDLSAALLSC